MVRTAYGYIRFLKVEFGFILSGLALTFAFYVALYLFSSSAPAQRSLPECAFQTCPCGNEFLARLVDAVSSLLFRVQFFILLGPPCIA